MQKQSNQENIGGLFRMKMPHNNGFRTYDQVGTLVLWFVVVLWLCLKQAFMMDRIGLYYEFPLIIATFGSTLFVFTAVLRLSGRVKLFALAALNLLVTLIVYVDIVYYRQFKDLTSVAAVRYSGQLVDFAQAIAPLMKRIDMILFVDTAALLLLIFLPQRFVRFVGAKSSRKTLLVTALAGLLVVGWSIQRIGGSHSKWGGHTFIAKNTGFLTYHVFDLVNYANTTAMRWQSPAPYAAAAQAWQAAQPQERGDAQGIARGKNVIMLQVEALQGFTIGMKVNGQEVTPNLNRLRQESLYFPNFFHQIGHGSTSDAELLVNCSLHPTPEGSVYFDYPTNQFRCLPRLLKEAGYSTTAFHGANPNFWNRSQIYPQLGFDRFLDERDYPSTHRFGYGLSDEAFFAQTADELLKLPKPFYAFVITLSSHTPFDWKELPHGLTLGKLEGTHLGNYLQAVHYADKAIGQFVTALRENGLLDQSVLFLYGDHMGITDDDELREVVPFGKADPVPSLLLRSQVPFMMRLPESGLHGDVLRVGGQIDLTPTLLHLLDLQPKQTFLMGQNLLGDAAPLVTLHSGSAISEQYVYMEELGACFDRSTKRALPASTCAPMEAAATDALRISASVLQRDLIPLITAPR